MILQSVNAFLVVLRLLQFDLVQKYSETFLSIYLPSRCGFRLTQYENLSKVDTFREYYTPKLFLPNQNVENGEFAKPFSLSAGIENQCPPDETHVRVYLLQQGSTIK